MRKNRLHLRRLVKTLINIVVIYSTLNHALRPVPDTVLRSVFGSH